MRKYQKAAVAVAMLGSVSLLGAGVGHAAGQEPKPKADNNPQQNQKCSADEKNFGVINIGDVNVNVNLLGIQVNDKSERTNVKCAQAAVPGGK